MYYFCRIRSVPLFLVVDHLWLAFSSSNLDVLFFNVHFHLILVALLTLTAIDGLGGYRSSMDDDAQLQAQKLGVAILYFIFAIITVLSLIFIIVVVPETKGKTPEELRYQNGPREVVAGTSIQLAMNQSDHELSGSTTAVNPLLHK